MKKKTTKRTNKKLSELLAPKPVWCDYADEKLIPKYIVHRFDDRGGNRFYYFKTETEEIVIASGITAPFGIVSTERDAINKWKEKYPNWKHLLDVSSEYGTFLHIIFGKITLKLGVDQFILDAMKKLALDNGQSQDMPVKDTLALLKFQEDYQLIPLLVEAQLGWRCPKTGEWLCMTIDILARMVTTEVVKTTVQDGIYLRGPKKGEPKMIEQKTEVKKERVLIGDLKSNFFEKEGKSYYETHVMQLIGGAKAVEQNFGIKVDGCFNFSPNAWRTTPSYSFHEHNITTEDLDIFDAYWNLIVRKRLNVPKGQLLVTDKIKDSSDYKWLSYQEYAKEQLQ
jgi:hypothetical protein